MVDSALTAVDATQARLRARAARRACFAAAPEVFFATHFLPRTQRQGVDCLTTVLAQLRQIMIPPTATCAPGQAIGEGTTGCASCATTTGGASGPARRDFGAASGAASGGGGGGSCEGESVPQRRAVCAAVLDFLLSGRPTGKPELDGFAKIARAAALPRADLDQFCDGLAIEATLPRYATWTRLRQMCEQTAGAAALLAFGLLQGGEPHSSARGQPDAPSAASADRDQIVALGTALRMARLLESIGADLRDGRLMLPLDDLVKFNVRESEITAMAKAGGLPNDPDIVRRWRGLMAFEIERVRRLYAGGATCLVNLKGSSRRAAAVFSQLQLARLTRLERSGYDAFLPPAPLRLRERLRILPAAMRTGVAQGS